MGLENGIQLVSKTKIDFDDWEHVPDYIDVEFDEYDTNRYNDGYYYNVCYWRKYQGIRESILDIIDEDGDGRFEIESKYLYKIQDVLYNVLRNPDEWRSSIWSINEAARNIAQCIINLSWLADYINIHQGSKAIFYDSY